MYFSFNCRQLTERTIRFAFLCVKQQYSSNKSLPQSYQKYPVNYSIFYIHHYFSITSICFTSPLDLSLAGCIYWREATRCRDCCAPSRAYQQLTIQYVSCDRQQKNHVLNFDQHAQECRGLLCVLCSIASRYGFSLYIHMQCSLCLCVRCGRQKRTIKMSSSRNFSRMQLCCVQQYRLFFLRHTRRYVLFLVADRCRCIELSVVAVKLLKHADECERALQIIYHLII